MNKDINITIVGLGLLGGCYAQGLSLKGYKVNAIDINEESIQFAKDKGWIADGGTSVDFLKDADLIISGLYPNLFVEWVKTNQHLFKSGALLTDVTGIKRTVIEKINSFLREDVEYIACHPMAGKEVSGVKYSDCNIFKGANFIIVPTESNTQEAINQMYNLATILEFKNISQLTPEMHDEMIGFVSQLTHVIAVTLMNTNDNTHLKEYTGDSFRDLTRIAKINENMWTELFIGNKELLLKEIEAFQDELEHFRQVLINEDTDEMKRLFIQSTKRRKEFDV